MAWLAYIASRFTEHHTTTY